MSSWKETFWSALRTAGMTFVPEQFSVVPFPQKIPQSILAELATFIGTFDRVTGRRAWQEKVTARCPQIARLTRQEVCFFSAWDFHLPPERPGDWQLIEFNDNGSGLLLAGLINAIFYELAPESERTALKSPLTFPALNEWVANIVETEARRFFGTFPPGIFLILDDAESLHSGKFRSELKLMCDCWRQRGWQVVMSAPEATENDRERLFVNGEEVSVVVKPRLCLRDRDVYLWTDLRVWAYRGEIFCLSGRASCHPERLDLTLPGGWLPTLIKVEEKG